MGSQFCIPASDPGHILYQPSLSSSLCSQRTAPRTRALSGQTGLTYTLHMFHVYSFIQEHSNKYYLLMAKNFVQFILQCFSLKVIFQDICKIFAGVYRMRTAEIGLLHFIELFTPRRLLLAADNPDAGWLTAPAPLPVPHLSSPACNQWWQLLLVYKLDISMPTFHSNPGLKFF